jgi:TIR domain-containing protein
MADPGKTVFLSYRRDVSGPMAYLVRNDLVTHGFDVFMDVGSLGGGAFEPVILREIEARTHFLVLLEPGSLDRIGEPGDWLRREIAHALTRRRNVVPMLAGGVRMPRAADLPADLAGLPSLNHVTAYHEYLDAAMEKLRGWLRNPPHPVPASPTTGVMLPDRVLRDLLGLPPCALGRPVLAHHRALSPLVVGVSWSTVDGATSYDVQQSSTADFIGARLVHLHGDATTYDVLHSELDRGRFFRVCAVARQGFDRGPWSNVVEVH